jgi:hypothetical protein
MENTIREPQRIPGPNAEQQNIFNPLSELCKNKDRNPSKFIKKWKG